MPSAGHPPKKLRSQGYFTVHYVHNGLGTTVTIALPYSDHYEHSAWQRHALSVFNRTGIAVLDNSNSSA